MDDLYLDSIIDRYKHPTNKGWIEDAGIYKTHNPSCGDRFEIAILWKDGKVVGAKWRGEGCAISTVSTDAFCEWAIGKTKEDLATYNQQRVKEQTEIETITPAREKCLYLPLTISFQ
jgi:nitrogen fixation NifU-like protein